MSILYVGISLGSVIHTLTRKSNAMQYKDDKLMLFGAYFDVI